MCEDPICLQSSDEDCSRLNVQMRIHDLDGKARIRNNIDRRWSSPLTAPLGKMTPIGDIMVKGAVNVILPLFHPRVSRKPIMAAGRTGR